MPRTSTLFDPRTAIPWVKGFWADDPSWVQKPANGQPVSTWRNFGSRAGDAEQSDQTKCPIYRSSVSLFNGRSAVQGDGVDDYLVAPIVASQPFTHVRVSSWGKSAASEIIFGGWGNQAVGPQVDTGSGYGNAVTMYANAYAVLTGFTQDSSAHLYVTGFLSGTGYGFSESLYVSTSGFASAGLNPSLYLCGVPNVNYCSPGYLCFAGIYSGDITAHAQWGNFKEWVRSYYGINVARGSV